MSEIEVFTAKLIIVVLLFESLVTSANTFVICFVDRLVQNMGIFSAIYDHCGPYGAYGLSVYARTAKWYCRTGSMLRVKNDEIFENV